MGVGGLFFAIVSLLGIHGLLLAVPSLYWVLEVLGGSYLVYLGMKIWLGARKPLSTRLLCPNVCSGTPGLRASPIGAG